MPSPKVIGIAVVVLAAALGFVPGVPGLIGGDPPAEDEAAAEEDPNALPPAPAIDQVHRGAMAEPTDDLIRVIVRPIGPPADAVTPVPIAAGPTEEPTEEPEPTPTVAEEPPPDGSEGSDAEPETEGIAQPTAGSLTEPVASPEPAPTVGTDDAPGDADVEDLPEPIVSPDDAPPTGDEYPINADTLEALTGGARLELDDEGRPWAVWRDGTRVPLWVAIPDATPTPAAPTPTVAATPTPSSTPTSVPTENPPPVPAGGVMPDESFGHPTIDMIAGLSNVKSIRPIGDGSFAVVLWQAGALDGLPIEIIEDAPMAIAAESSGDAESEDESDPAAPAGDDDAADSSSDENTDADGDGDGAEPDDEQNNGDTDPEPAEPAEPQRATDPYEGFQWAIENTGTNLATVGGGPPQNDHADISAVETIGVATGAGVVIAVVDTGIDFAHPDLAPAQWKNADERCDNQLDDDNNGFVDDCTGWDFVSDDATPFNPGAHPHGTHVAGIIAAARNQFGIVGVAPEATLMDLNVAAQTTSGLPSINTSDVARAIRYAVDNEADIINVALATAPGARRELSAPIEAAIDHARANGVVVITAAGNHGVDLAESPTWPAAFDHTNLITVAASDPTDTKAFFSSWGEPVDVFAPGVLALSTVPVDVGDLRFMSGTSQAAAVVSGIAALILDDESDLSPEDVATRLRTTGDHIEQLLPFVTGGVRVNAGGAIDTAEPVHLVDRPVVTVDGLAGASRAEPVAVSIYTAVPAEMLEVDHDWMATLVRVTASGPLALVGLDVMVDGRSRTSDDSGRIPLGFDESDWATVEFDIGAGDYVLVVEAVDDGRTIGDPQHVAFEVSDAARATVAAESDDRSDATDRLDPLIDGPLSVGEWEVNRIQPASGAVGSTQAIEIWGWFPEPVYVWFGDTPGTVIRQSDSELFVVPPHNVAPGATDIAFTHNREGTLFTIASGYVFLDPQATSTEPNDTSAETVDDADAAGAGDDLADGDTTGDLEATVAQTDDTTQDIEPATPATAGGFALADEITTLPDGLRGRAIVGDNPLTGTAPCRVDPCLLG